ncbi:MAG: four helix bundle protein [Patescibacteria group bacterium]|nr:four helix bundle protein [Patescibacteria group bacterium]
MDERTSQFAEQIIDFCKSIRQDLITKPIISQLVRAGTSIGANYSEADEAGSKKDFINKMTIAKKEIKETRYWLRLIAYTLPEIKDKIQPLSRESQELNLIFATIVRNAKN